MLLSKNYKQKNDNIVDSATNANVATGATSIDFSIKDAAILPFVKGVCGEVYKNCGIIYNENFWNFTEKLLTVSLNLAALYHNKEKINCSEKLVKTDKDIKIEVQLFCILASIAFKYKIFILNAKNIKWFIKATKICLSLKNKYFKLFTQTYNQIVKLI